MSATHTETTLGHPVSSYLQRARRYDLLSREEEHEIALRWVESRDATAFDQLVTANLRLVAKYAFQYRRAHWNVMDLIQEGNIGLLHAVRKFDPHRGVKLATYASWWIRAYMLRFILRNYRLVRIGTTRSQQKLFFNLRKEQAKLMAAGIEPDSERVAAAIGVPAKEVAEMAHRLGAPDQSLDAPISFDEDRGTTRVQQLEDPDASSSADFESSEFRELVSAKLREFGATLSGRELDVFRDRLTSANPVSFAQLGERWGLSRERARQIEQRLLKPLRRFLANELGDSLVAQYGRV